MFKASIILNSDIENIKKLLSVDNFNAKTSKVNYEIKNNLLHINVESEDIVSLRASLNGLTSSLSIYYNSKKLVD